MFYVGVPQTLTVCLSIAKGEMLYCFKSVKIQIADMCTIVTTTNN